MANLRASNQTQSVIIMPESKRCCLYSPDYGTKILFHSLIPPPIFNTKVKKNTTHKTKLDNVLSISTDAIQTLMTELLSDGVSFPVLGKRATGTQWPRWTQHMNTEELADSGKRLCVGKGNGRRRLTFLDTNYVPRDGKVRTRHLRCQATVHTPSTPGL